MTTKTTREKTLKELKGLLLYKTNLLEQGLYWQLTEDLQYLLEKPKKKTTTNQLLKKKKLVDREQAKKEFFKEIENWAKGNAFGNNWVEWDAIWQHIEHLLDKSCTQQVKNMDTLVMSRAEWIDELKSVFAKAKKEQRAIFPNVVMFIEDLLEKERERLLRWRKDNLKGWVCPHGVYISYKGYKDGESCEKYHPKFKVKK